MPTAAEVSEGVKRTEGYRLRSSCCIRAMLAVASTLVPKANITWCVLSVITVVFAVNENTPRRYTPPRQEYRYKNNENIGVWGHIPHFFDSYGPIIREDFTFYTKYR